MNGGVWMLLGLSSSKQGDRVMFAGESWHGQMILISSVMRVTEKERKQYITIVTAAHRSPPAVMASRLHDRPCHCWTLPALYQSLHDVACHCMSLWHRCYEDSSCFPA